MKTILTKNGYSRLLQIINGCTPVIRTVGILSCEFPSHELQTSRKSRLNESLKQGNYMFIRIKDQYGNESRNHFLILNIGKDHLKEHCADIGVKSFIWGYVSANEGVEFSLIENDSVTAKKTILYNPEENPGLISSCTGSDFELPFFEISADEKEIENCENVYPCSEDILFTNLVNPHKLSYTYDEISIYENAVETIAQIYEINERYAANGKDAYEYGGMGNWGRRGRLLVLTNELAVKISELN